MKQILALSPAAAAALLIVASAAAQTPQRRITERIGLDQRLGAQVPLNLEFRDETGQSVRLAKYFKDKPVVLAIVQYRCPMLCTQVLNGLLKSSQAVELQMGRDYEVVTVSLDSRETPEMALRKKKRYAGSYRRPGAEEGWHFLTGDQESIDTLCRTVGYRYVYDERTDQFAHPSGLVLLTPGGRTSRYLYGIDYHPTDLRLGLVESSENRIGSPVDQILLLCFHYDPATGKYGFAIASVMRLAGLATMLTLGTFLVVMYRREVARSRAARLEHPAINGSSPGAGA